MAHLPNNIVLVKKFHRLHQSAMGLKLTMYKYIISVPNLAFELLPAIGHAYLWVCNEMIASSLALGSTPKFYKGVNRKFCLRYVRIAF